MNVTQVRQAMVTAMAPLQASPYFLNLFWYKPKVFTAPCVYVWPNGIEFDKAMQRGLDDMAFTVSVRLNSSKDDQGWQITLDTLLNGGGAGSMKATLETDKTLGGVIHNLRVVSATIVDSYYEEGSQTSYGGADFQVIVRGSGA